MEIYLHDIDDPSLIPQLWLTVKLETYSLLNPEIISILEQLANAQLTELLEIVVPTVSPHTDTLQSSGYQAGLTTYQFNINKVKVGCHPELDSGSDVRSLKSANTEQMIDQNISILPDYPLTALMPLLKQQADYHHQLNPHIYSYVTNIDWTWYIEILQQHLTKTHDPIFVIHQDEQPIGLLTTFISDQQLNLWDLIVDSQHRGQGIARQLIHAAQVYAHQQDLQSLTLEAWTADTDLDAFYTHLGFTAREQSWYKLMNQV